MHPNHQVQRVQDERNHPLMRREAKEPTDFSMLALAAGVFAAVAGAVVWGAVYTFAQVEMVWVALGIGVFVGGAVVLARGRGTAMALTAAALAIVSILAGKVIGVEWSVQRLVHDPDMVALHVDLMQDARDLVQLGTPPDDADLEFFIEERGYGTTLAEFKATSMPQLLEWEAQPPNFEDWFASDVASTVSTVEIIRGELNAWDALFALGAIALAFGAVFSKTKQEEQDRIDLARRAAQREQALAA